MKRAHCGASTALFPDYKVKDDSFVARGPCLPGWGPYDRLTDTESPACVGRDTKSEESGQAA